MKEIRVKKLTDIDYRTFIKRSAQETDFDTLIKEPCVVKDETGKVLIIYDYLDIDTSNVVNALRSTTYHEGQRARGLVSRSRIFGYRPRLEMLGDFCSTTSMAHEHPTEHAIVTGFALELEEYYKRYYQEGYERHKGLSEAKVKKSYRIGGKSIFTSGIINKNNPLKYHFDTGNFKDVYSAMVVFKGGIEGGYLCCPEYRIAFELPHNSIFLFDGQGIMHGVTPIKFQDANSYRYSVVYYSLKRMWQCLELDEELARVRQKKTRRERLRMNNHLTEEERVAGAKNREDLKKRFGKQ